MPLLNFTLLDSLDKFFSKLNFCQSSRVKCQSAKGQIISKQFFSGRRFAQKTNENTSHASKNEFICSFFGESSAWLFLFEINWPLGCSGASDKIDIVQTQIHWYTNKLTFRCPVQQSGKWMHSTWCSPLGRWNMDKASCRSQCGAQMPLQKCSLSLEKYRGGCLWLWAQRLKRWSCSTCPS